MSNLQNVDPAVVASKARPQPLFPLCTRTVSYDEENNAYTPAVNFETDAVVKCSDKTVTIPREALAKTPYASAMKEGEEVAEVELPGDVLASIVHWCEKYGKDGSSESKFPSLVTHTEFNTLLTNDWEKNFFNRVLLQHDSSEVLFGTINAAEKNGMAGLLEFCIVGLSCQLRGKSEADILATMHISEPIPEDELKDVPSKLAWFAETTKPKVY